MKEGSKEREKEGKKERQKKGPPVGLVVLIPFWVNTMGRMRENSVQRLSERTL